MERRENLSKYKYLLEVLNKLPNRALDLLGPPRNHNLKERTKKIIEMPDIGYVHLQKYKTAKSLKIIIRPYRPAKLTIPYRVSFQEAEKFLMSKKIWLKENLEKIRQSENKNRISEEEIEILRLKAKDHLPKRLKNLAQKHNLKYNRLFIKNLRSRWGSCSIKNNINLNLHLMRLPDNLIDYVILHELAHTKEKNHGQGFYTLLSSLEPDFKAQEKELKRYSII